MKLLVIGNEERTRKYLPDLPITREVDIVVAERGSSNEEILALAPDADFILADAIAPVDAELIERMPNLKLIHSEGVGFNLFDCESARARGIYVCNNRGVNAIAVAEQTLLLMLGLCKHVCAGDKAVRAGKQINMKESLMVSGIEEIYGSTIGLVGFGDIAREVAVRAHAFGARVFYNKRTPLSPEDEKRFNARYLSVDEMLACSDFVSIHVPVTPQTTGMVDAEFFAKMKDGAYLINTARGEIVDNDACVEALASGKIAGAGFDTLAPEPVQADNPLLNLPEDLQEKVLFSPHIGGVTTNMFKRAHTMAWENIARVANGEAPINIVS